MPSQATVPLPADVLSAAARIAPHAQATAVLESRTLNAAAGCQLYFKSEHLQCAGAFKFRGACNAVWSLSSTQARHGVVTHSSGNHGAALALAARTRGIACHVVVPEGAVPAKLAAVAAYGGRLHRCAPTLAAREAACAALAAETGATLLHPYTDPRVIAGQGTATLELLAQAGALDVVVVPVGGGGLAAGAALALAAAGSRAQLILAEPAGAADTAASLASGTHVVDLVPRTLCDGLRATVGAPNLGILRAAGAEVITVDDADTLAAMQLLWTRLKQVVEPSSAVALAAVLQQPARFAGQRVGVILSGGNVDLSTLAGAMA